MHGERRAGVTSYTQTLPFGTAVQVFSTPLSEVAYPEVHPLMMLRVSDLESSDAAVFKYQFFFFHSHGEDLVALYTSDPLCFDNIWTFSLDLYLSHLFGTFL